MEGEGEVCLVVSLQALSLVGELFFSSSILTNIRIFFTRVVFLFVRSPVRKGAAYKSVTADIVVRDARWLLQRCLVCRRVYAGSVCLDTGITFRERETARRVF